MRLIKEIKTPTYHTSTKRWFQFLCIELWRNHASWSSKRIMQPWCRTRAKKCAYSITSNFKALFLDRALLRQELQLTRARSYYIAMRINCTGIINWQYSIVAFALFIDTECLNKHKYFTILYLLYHSFFRKMQDSYKVRKNSEVINAYTLVYGRLWLLHNNCT